MRDQVDKKYRKYFSNTIKKFDLLKRKRKREREGGKNIPSTKRKNTFFPKNFKRTVMKRSHGLERLSQRNLKGEITISLHLSSMPQLWKLTLLHALEIKEITSIGD